MRLSPLRALRPTPELAGRVASPPYDVVSAEEAARLAADNPLSFLRVVRSEIDLPPGTDSHDERVYARARENLDRLVDDGALVREDRPALYVYRLVIDGRAQVGVAGGVHVDDYERGVIRKHETTRPDKEDDRTRHILTVRAHAEPVLLMHRDRDDIARLARAETAKPPLLDLVAPDGVRHTLWRVDASGPWVQAFRDLPEAYVADGHHRSASAWRAARELRVSATAAAPAHDWFPAVLFPASELRILPYHRVVRDLAGRSPAAVVEALGRVGRLSPGSGAVLPGPGSFGFYLDRRWHQLELDPASIDAADPHRALDVSLLAERVLGPVLGVGDPRTDGRLDFVGGSRGARELQRRVDAGEAALGISLHPTTIAQLMAVVDAGGIMPPKSTWFEPKLASGLLVHRLD
jgi:uncharacterized protein (DUF1015 family)